MDGDDFYKGEEKAEIRLCEWLLKNGIKVYTNRNGVLKKIYGCRVFSIRGTRKKPDMLIRAGDEWMAIEIKPGEHGKEMRESDKIVNYYAECENGTAKYFLDDEKVCPRIFLIASFYSPEGRLFRNEERKKSSHTTEERRLFGCPDFEYYTSHTFIRTIWDRWKPIKNKEYAIGALLSDRLNSGLGNPLIFIQAYNSYLDKWSPPHSTWRINGSGRWRP